jgi:hypothetical protein
LHLEVETPFSTNCWLPITVSPMPFGFDTLAHLAAVFFRVSSVARMALLCRMSWSSDILHALLYLSIRGLVMYTLHI